MNKIILLCLVLLGHSSFGQLANLEGRWGDSNKGAIFEFHNDSTATLVYSGDTIFADGFTVPRYGFNLETKYTKYQDKKLVVVEVTSPGKGPVMPPLNFIYSFSGSDQLSLDPASGVKEGAAEWYRLKRLAKGEVLTLNYNTRFGEVLKQAHYDHVPSDYSDLKTLFEEGYKVNARYIANVDETYYETLLTFGVISQDDEDIEKLIDVLVSAGIDLEARNADGNTALFIAVVLRKEQAIKKLLASGASADVKNNTGKKLSELIDDELKPLFDRQN